MSIIIDRNTKVLVQGITGKEGSFWAKHMKEYGTQVVAGCTPFKEGQDVDGIPVYNSVQNAVKHHEIDASLLVVPPKGAYDAIMESINAGIRTLVVTAEGIPIHEMIRIRRYALEHNVCLLGGNTTGILSTGQAMMGFFPYWLDRVYQPGSVGVMTRSGSLTNEINAQIVGAGFGTTSVIGVGGDAIPCTRFSELLPLFEKDVETKAVVMIGEIGGSMEEEVAEAIEEGIFTKPLIGFMGGRTAPAGKQMGHAGAIVSGGRGSVADKVALLEKAGAYIADRPRSVGTLLQDILKS